MISLLFSTLIYYTIQSKRSLTGYYRTYDYFIDINHGQKNIIVHYLHIEEAHNFIGLFPKVFSFVNNGTFLESNIEIETHNFQNNYYTYSKSIILTNKKLLICINTTCYIESGKTIASIVGSFYVYDLPTNLDILFYTNCIGNLEYYEDKNNNTNQLICLGKTKSGYSKLNISLSSKREYYNIPDIALGQSETYLHHIFECERKFSYFICKILNYDKFIGQSYGLYELASGKTLSYLLHQGI